MGQGWIEKAIDYIFLARNEDGKCSETSGNHPKEGIQHSEHGESLKSRKIEYYQQAWGEQASVT